MIYGSAIFPVPSPARIRKTAELNQPLIR